MKKKGVILIIGLILFSLVVLAEGEPVSSSALEAKQLETFRAQILKDFDDRFKELKEQLIQNEDINAGSLDERTKKYMEDSEKRIIVGVLGISLFINSLMAYLLNRINKKYSFSTYERDLLKRFPNAPVQQQVQPQQPMQEAVYQDVPQQQPQYPVYQEYNQEEQYQEQYPAYPQDEYSQEQM